MIICPECRFENPDRNRFCQDCGTDLQSGPSSAGSLGETASGRERDDLGQDSEKPLGPKGHSVSPNLPQQLVILSVSDSQSRAEGSDADLPATLTQELTQQRCLAERYQVQPSRLTEGDAPSQLDLPSLAARQEIEVMVVDMQPSNPPFLDAALVDASSGALSDDLESVLKTLPTLVRIHLLLQDELYPSCPQVEDAWTGEDYSALVLENRERLPLLSEAVEAAIGEQILHWLYDMVRLWELLASYQCHQSLLDPDNLRVDEDQILCLKRLYQNRPGEDYSLRRLGSLWRQLFDVLTDLPGYPQGLRELSKAIASGDSTLDNVKQRLDAVRAAYEQTLASAEAAAPQTRPAEAEQVADYPFDEGDDLPTVVLPMQLYSLSDAGHTDVGRMRKHNEDCFFIQTDIQKRDSPEGRTCTAKGLYILCDGMGGHASGEVASSLAVETLRKSLQSWTTQLPTETSLSESIRLANQAIYEQNQQNNAQGNRRMGTTLVMLLVQGLQVAIAHVGDSRLYRVSRKFGLEQLTVDHEVGQREIHRGIEPEVAYSRQDAYQLTQALGPRSQEFIRPDIQYMPITEDAVFILASDGLTDNDLLEEHYDTHLEQLLSSQANLEQGVANLIGLANHHNGHDNITAIAVRIKLRPVMQPQMG